MDTCHNPSSIPVVPHTMSLQLTLLTTTNRIHAPVPLRNVGPKLGFDIIIIIKSYAADLWFFF